MADDRQSQRWTQGATVPTASEVICEALRDRILSGQLHPGERLVLEPIAKEFGVSPIPVRDALRQLEREHLVQGRPKYGYRVIQVDPEELLGLWNYREALECQTARLCAVKATAKELAELEALACEADVIAEDPESNLVLDEREVRLHRRIAEIAGFEELLKGLNRVHHLIGLFRKPWQGDLPERLHTVVVQAIASGDPDRAERAMREHMTLRDEDVRRLTEALKQQLEPDAQ